MKIQQNQTLQLNSRKQNNGTINKNTTQTQSFKGLIDPATLALRFLDTNQAWGANFVDLAFMVTPRTAVDFTRGPEAGVETMRREASGTVNHSLVGVYGLGAAALLSTAFNKKYGVKANKIFVSSENLDIMAQAKNNTKNQSEYLDEILSKIKGFNPSESKKNPWDGLDEITKTSVKEVLEKELKNEELSKESKNYLKALITRAIGSESKVKLDGATSDSSLETLLDNIYKVTKSFDSQKVKEAFTKASSLADNAFIKGMKSLSTKTSLAGLGIAVALGCAIQPFNMYLTRKKTGKDGFVGVEGREPDKTSKFKIMKLAAAGAFGTMALRIISKPSELLSKLQFKGGAPTINQFKLVYGITIMSRLLSARDQNELREATIKDTLGFLNWLVLGNFVAKLTAAGCEKLIKGDNKSLLNFNEGEQGKGFWNWITKATIKTRDEVLHAELKKVGIETVTKESKAIPVKELLKSAAEHAPHAISKIKFLNVAQLAGYVYSGLVLGMGIPKLNIAITKAFDKNSKNKAKVEELPVENNATKPQVTDAAKLTA